jgi:hypothetical protein
MELITPTFNRTPFSKETKETGRIKKPLSKKWGYGNLIGPRFQNDAWEMGQGAR